MDSDDDMQGKPQLPIARKRWWRRPLLFVAVVLPILFACLLWITHSERGTQSSLSFAAGLSSGVLQIDGVSGTWSDALHIDKLTVHLKNQKIVADNIALDLQLAQLLTGKLHVNLLHVGKLGIVSKIAQDDEPSRLPASIALPIRVQIDRVQVDSGDIAWGPLNVIALGAFAFKLDFDGKRYLLNLDEFSARSQSDKTVFSGTLSGQATLSTTSPYPLQATLSSNGETVTDGRSINAKGQLALHGSLDEMLADVDLHIAEATMSGTVALRPFSEKPLGKADVTARALDLSLIAASLPKTALNVDLHATENGEGTLIVTNPAAGLYNEGRIPLERLRIAFAQKDDAFSFNRITVALGSAKQAAGTIEGNGKLANGTLALTLKTAALNLQQIDQRVRATQLAGNLDIRHADGKQTFALALSEPLKKNPLTLNAHATVADDAVNVDKAELRAGNSAIDLSARIALSGNQAFDTKGRIRTFNPRDFGDFAQLPTLLVNGEFSASGSRHPTLEADAAFRIADSKLAGNALTGEGRAQLRADALTIPALSLNAGVNRISAQGKLAQRDSRIVFIVDASKLEQLGAGFGGALKIDGEVRGNIQQPHIAANWNGSRIRTPAQMQFAILQGKADVTFDRRTNNPLVNSVDIDATAQGLHIGEQQLKRLAINARYGAQASAPLSLHIRGDGIGGNLLEAENFGIDANGTTAQHTLVATLNEQNQTWKLTASGGLQELARMPRWQGRIDTFDAAGRLNAHLAAAAPLLISQRQVQLDQADINVGNGGNNAIIAIEQFLRNDRGIATRGRLEHVQIGELLRYLKPDAPLSTDLTLAGEWDIKLGNRLDGSFALRRETGDIAMLSNAPVKLGLTNLSINGSAGNGRLALAFLAEGSQVGRIDVNLNTTIAGNRTWFTIAPGAPLIGTARIATPTLTWLGPMISPTLVTEGSLNGNVALGGTFGRPQFSGQINADNLRVLFADTGVDLRHGTLRSEFRGDQLVISQLGFQNDGTLSITGPLSMVREQLALELSVSASKYKLIDRSDRKLVVSGSSVIGWRNGQAKANGMFTADSGYFDIGSTDTPQLSDDVVIVGRNAKQGTKTVIALDLKLNLGKGIHLQGRGLDAMLAGEINLLASAGDTLRALGDLRIASGTFKAYGRELAIEQGILHFSGPLNNPALNIIAMRRGQEVEAGVSVGGTVLSPRITLVSDPTVADAEKLSWLVLGHGLSGVGDSDIGALQTAASSLLAQGAASGLQSQIATMFGLDDFSVGTENTGNLQERIVTLGKKISSRLYVSYQQGLENASSVLLLRYTLTPRVTVEAEAGTRSALSLFYNFAFD
ncbi:MAG TPA: translocation/assembly module TamB domain-containing protein [Oxalicibacterium sp.]|uniref:translocation/assembly module TamB domain-containing protein n=1 Tax=Oxalicibacterium sp. TaxID=2766525 RepID=UPI002C345C31|nr:translocation/assembly module TamB domain-containing protein [Oxalicibacterium sp.]HWU98431.1 translocation/assembly module TamB domain-containing protein [Oxalicibacterium sp.]